jgi:hypothetical protein
MLTVSSVEPLSSTCTLMPGGTVLMHRSILAASFLVRITTSMLAASLASVALSGAGNAPERNAAMSRDSPAVTAEGSDKRAPSRTRPAISPPRVEVSTFSDPVSSTAQ